MPELPEVETIVRQLDAMLPGRVVDSVEVLREKSARSELEPMVGKTIKRVSRKAKYLAFWFEEWDEVLLSHLKMTGQYIFVPGEEDDPPSSLDKLRTTDGQAGQFIFQKSEARSPTSSVGRQKSGKNDEIAASQAPRNDTVGAYFENPEGRVVGGHPSPDWVQELPSNHTRILMRFEDGSTLYFNDMRVFGWMKLMEKEAWEEKKASMPPDVVDEDFTIDYLAEQLSRSSQAIKKVILDQKRMGGIGNIYASDALWLARIHPEKPAKKLSGDEVERLHGTMQSVLLRGIAVGGASESTYKHIDGYGGSYQKEFLVFQREGEACLRESCDGVIEKMKVGGRGTYYCPECQA